MKSRRTFPFLSIPVWLLCILITATTHAATIESTTFGGPWHDPATWVGGVVPTAADDVVIFSSGTVTVSGSPECLSLHVTTNAVLAGAASAPPRQLTVHTDILNEGQILDGPYGLDLVVGGNLHNGGFWENSYTILRGAGPHTISEEGSNAYHTDLVLEAGSAAEVHLTTAVTVQGNITTNDGRLILDPDCFLTLRDGNFQGNLDAGGNDFVLEGWSYLSNCVLDDAVLVGNAGASFNVVATTRLVVLGTLQNGGTGGGGAITILGDLENYGTITHHNYSFNVIVHGDVVNHGEISNPILQLEGAGATHHLSMDGLGVFEAIVFLPEFVESTIIGHGPLHFANDLALGDGTLILDGTELLMTGFASLRSGTIEANGSVINWSSNGALGAVTVDRGVLFGEINVTAGSIFTGGLTIDGLLDSGSWAEAHLTVSGLLQNRGTVSDGNTPVRITALNDVENTGSFTNTEVIMGGTEDQAIGVGLDFHAPLVLESDLNAGPYQWYQDGALLPGATTATLTLTDLDDPANHGTYHCTNGVASGRSVLVMPSLETSAAPVPLAGALLEQNHPNPFNPATELAFTLVRGGPVLLEVFDLAGRRVDTLVRGELDAGRHSVTWQPRDLPSGTYFYALKTENGTRVRKCVLLK